MLSGVVDIVITGTDLALNGDGENNQVEIRSTGVPGQYEISSPDDTLFILNTVGPPPTFPSLTVNGISGNIAANLGDGNDLFRFLGVSQGVPSTVGGNLIINNADGSNVNELIDTRVNGDFNVNKAAPSSGYSELLIQDSTIVGDTIVNNVGAGTGTTKTVIDNSVLQGGGATLVGLNLTNPAGSDTVEVLASSQFGTGPAIVGPVVLINNGAGPSRVSFAGTSQIAGPGTTTVYGDININNGANVAGTFDLLTFNSVNVLGRVAVVNAAGDTDTMIVNSALGSRSTLTPATGHVSVDSDAGFDSLFIRDSYAPWGLRINNDLAAGGTSTWGSTTNVTNSRLGEFLAPLTDIGLQVSGDNGNDVVIVQQSTIAAQLNTLLFGGNNTTTLQNNPQSISVFTYTGGAGNDTVSIDNTRIYNKVDIKLFAGADRLNIHNVDYQTQWPVPLLDNIQIDGGVGMDTFSGDIPLNNVFKNFEFFVA